MNTRAAVMLLLFEDIQTGRLTDMAKLRCASLTPLRIKCPPAADADDCFIFMVFHRQNPSCNLPR